MAGPLGKYPGQSVTMCSGVLVPPFLPVMRSAARPGRAASSRSSAGTSPPLMATVSSMVTWSAWCMITP
jgi:hypothetical protein